MANEEKDPDYRVDGDVKLMGNNGRRRRRGPPAASAVGSDVEGQVARSGRPLQEAAKEFRPLKPGGNPTTPPSN